jgi:hypothetical protein
MNAATLASAPIHAYRPPKPKWEEWKDVLSKNGPLPAAAVRRSNAVSFAGSQQPCALGFESALVNHSEIVETRC